MANSLGNFTAVLALSREPAVRSVAIGPPGTASVESISMKVTYEIDFGDTLRVIGFPTDYVSAHRSTTFAELTENGVHDEQLARRMLAAIESSGQMSLFYVGDYEFTHQLAMWAAKGTNLGFRLTAYK
ncbi:MAG: hypothetical protein ACJ8F7_12480, partial [Gemmataceae bacterium]